MNRGFILILIFCWITACSAENSQYYSLNPKALQKALQQCPNKPPQKISCKELQNIAEDVNALAYELQSNPQEYGKRILALQEAIAIQKVEMKKKSSNSGLRGSLHKNKQSLNQRLAVVKWLESPES